MFGTLAGALSGRKVPFDRDQFSAAVEGRIAGHGRTIRIETITVRYDLTITASDRAAVERALRVHPRGCPVHESIGAAIPIRWEATLRLGDTGETVSLRDEGEADGA